MKIKIENDKKTKNLNILQALKRVLLDEDNGIEDPELDDLAREYKDIPDAQKTDEDKMNEILIEELKKSQSKIDNRFKDVLKVKPHKLKESASKSEDKKIDKKIEKERID